MKNNVTKIKKVNFYKCYGILIAFVFILTINISCENKKNTEKKSTKVRTVIPTPVFNEDSAYKFIQTQVDFGPRVPNTKAHIACGDYLISQLKKYGCEVIVQEFEVTSFDNKRLKARNIIGIYNPQIAKRVLLSAHWDSRPFADQDTKDTQKPIDGANDGASGVAVILELARNIQLSAQKPDIGIDIIFFDVEDYGQPENSGYPTKESTWCLGSQHWAKNKHIANYTAYYGVLLDMVGAKNAKFAMEGTSIYYAPGVVKKIWDVANSLGYGNFFVYDQVDNITDDHYYINTIAKIPTADIIEYENSDGSFFSPSWHTHNDNMDIIDKTTLKAVGQTLLQVLYNE